METASLRIKFTPLIKDFEKGLSKCCLEIVPEISATQNMESIARTVDENNVEYTIPMTYKIIIKKKSLSNKESDDLAKIYHSCVDLHNYSFSNIGYEYHKVVRMFSDNILLKKFASNVENCIFLTKEIDLNEIRNKASRRKSIVDIKPGNGLKSASSPSDTTLVLKQHNIGVMTAIEGRENWSGDPASYEPNEMASGKDEIYKYVKLKVNEVKPKGNDTKFDTYKSRLSLSPICSVNACDYPPKVGHKKSSLNYDRHIFNPKINTFKSHCYNAYHTNILTSLKVINSTNYIIEDETNFAEKSFDDQNIVNKNFDGQNFGNKSFDDQNFSKKSFDDQYFIKKRFDDQNFVKKRIVDQSFIKKSFDLQNFGNKSFDDQNFVKKRFDDQNFVKKSFDDKSFGNKSFYGQNCGNKSFDDQNVVKRFDKQDTVSNNNLTKRVLPEIRVASFLQKLENEILPLHMLLNEIKAKCLHLGVLGNRLEKQEVKSNLILYKNLLDGYLNRNSTISNPIYYDSLNDFTPFHQKLIPKESQIMLRPQKSKRTCDSNYLGSVTSSITQISEEIQIHQSSDDKRESNKPSISTEFSNVTKCAKSNNSNRVVYSIVYDYSE